MSVAGTVFRSYARKSNKYVSKLFIRKHSTSDNERYVVKSKVPPIVIPQNELIQDFIWKNIDKWHDKTALECIETGRSYTYGELQSISKKLSFNLRKMFNLKDREAIAMVIPNIPEYAIIFFGALEAGLCVSTVNPIYTADEICKQLISSESKVVFTTTPLWLTVQNALKKCGKKLPVVVVKTTQNESTPIGAIKFEELCQSDSFYSTRDVGQIDTAILPYSSGTTGLPKGVELTHGSVVANLYQMTVPEFKVNLETTSDFQETVPLFLPLFHAYGLIVILFNLLSQGCKMVTFPKFTSQIFLKHLQVHRPTFAFGVPPVILMLLNNEEFTLDKITCLRSIMSAAAPLGAADIERFHDKTKGQTDILQLYGLTETSPITNMQTRVLSNGVKIGGSGFLVPNTDCKVVSTENNETLGIGEVGELVFRGPQNMKGYYKNKEATDAAILEGNWLKTGDIGYIDEHEHFFITDRLKELIKVQGFQVAPAELEEILRDHPAVADAAVIGIKHEVTGEAPKAFVVIRNGSRISPEDLVNYVSSKVAPYKKLSGGLVVLENIPKTTSGKILRRQLKDM